jgi:hypothetical protein
MQIAGFCPLPVSVFTACAVFHSVFQIIAQDTAVAATTSRIDSAHAALILMRGRVAWIAASLILSLTSGQIVDLSLLWNAIITLR